jgi:hypothetical protein
MDRKIDAIDGWTGTDIDIDIDLIVQNGCLWEFVKGWVVGRRGRMGQ